jgi:molecular chaperone Hsp33
LVFAVRRPRARATIVGNLAVARVERPVPGRALRIENCRKIQNGRANLITMSTEEQTDGLEVRTYFVRGRNALVARAEFGGLYVDYYLHQGQYGYHHAPEHDGLLKEALAALTLHCASRPWNEAWAWTIHFHRPLLNLFVTGDNRRGIIVGQIFTDNVKDDGRNLFCADLVKEREGSRRSAVEFKANDPFAIAEEYYAQSEQRPARYFRHGPEDFVMVSAQPGCDLEWFNSLDDETVHALDENETLSLLEERTYRWGCGCSQERMFSILAPIMRSDPAGLFGDESVIRISCPRCGALHSITREALEAYLAESTEA